MVSLLRFFSYLILLPLLFSCASIEKQGIDENFVDKSGSVKYEAWLLNKSHNAEAINMLLNEVDILIASSRFNVATDKLERVLRIKTEYAPAWSRLSWIALQTNAPKRSVEMAKRSNSFAHGDDKLQLLNWSFIRTASKALNDENLYQRAIQKINALTSFY